MVKVTKPTNNNKMIKEENTIKIHSWKVAPDVKIRKSSEVSISAIEQEAHFNVSEYDKCIHVCVSDRKILTRLKKQPHFLLTDVLLNPFGRIIQVIGTLPLWTFSLRYKRRCNSSYEDSEVQE